MRAFKFIRFYLVLLLAFPLVAVYLIGAAIFSGQWLLLQLIHQSLYKRFVLEKGNLIT
jgi:hypothetical protein